MINCKLIVIDCNRLITCYLFFMIGDLVIFNNLIFVKGVPFCSKLARQGGTAQLREYEHISAKIFMFIQDYFVAFVLVVLRWFNTFKKNVSWSALLSRTCIICWLNNGNLNIYEIYWLVICCLKIEIKQGYASLHRLNS